MPRNDIHDMFENALLGYLTAMILLMDIPLKILKPHHLFLYYDLVRIIFLSAFAVGTFWDYVLARIIHVELDNLFDNSNKILRHVAKKSAKEQETFQKFL